MVLLEVLFELIFLWLIAVGNVIVFAVTVSCCIIDRSISIKGCVLCMYIGGQPSRTTFEFGRTHVVRPKGRHQATIIWLHGLGDKGSRYYVLFQSYEEIECM